MADDLKHTPEDLSSNRAQRPAGDRDAATDKAGDLFAGPPTGNESGELYCGLPAAGDGEKLFAAPPSSSPAEGHGGSGLYPAPPTGEAGGGARVSAAATGHGRWWVLSFAAMLLALTAGYGAYWLSKNDAHSVASFDVDEGAATAFDPPESESEPEDEISDAGEDDGNGVESTATTDDPAPLMSSGTLHVDRGSANAPELEDTVTVAEEGLPDSIPSPSDVSEGRAASPIPSPASEASLDTTGRGEGEVIPAQDVPETLPEIGGSLPPERGRAQGFPGDMDDDKADDGDRTPVNPATVPQRSVGDIDGTPKNRGSDASRPDGAAGKPPRRQTSRAPEIKVPRVEKPSGLADARGNENSTGGGIAAARGSRASGASRPGGAAGKPSRSQTPKPPKKKRPAAENPSELTDEQAVEQFGVSADEAMINDMCRRLTFLDRDKLGTAAQKARERRNGDQPLSDDAKQKLDLIISLGTDF